MLLHLFHVVGDGDALHPSLYVVASDWTAAISAWRRSCELDLIDQPRAVHLVTESPDLLIDAPGFNRTASLVEFAEEMVDGTGTPAVLPGQTDSLAELARRLASQVADAEDRALEQLLLTKLAGVNLRLVRQTVAADRIEFRFECDDVGDSYDALHWALSKCCDLLELPGSPALTDVPEVLQRLKEEGKLKP